MDIVIPFKPHRFQWEMWNESKRFNVFVCHRRMGKTVYEVNRLIRNAITTTKSDHRGAYIAPLLKQAKDIAWDYFKYFCGQIPGIKFNQSELKVIFPNGASIKLYGTDNPDGLRGIYLDDVTIDEVEQMHPELWHTVIYPTLMTRGGGGNFIGTPQGMGLFYDIYQEALADPDWHAKIYTIEDTQDDPDIARLLPPEEVEMAKKNMRASQFRQEFMCDWGANTDDVYISLDIIIPCVGKHIGEEDYIRAPKTMGIDIGRSNDATVICKRQGMATFPLISYNIPDNMLVATQIALEIDAFKPDAVFIDQGYGVGVIDRLRQLGYSVIEVPFGGSADDKDHFANKRAEMYGRARDWITLGGALPEDQELVADLSSPKIVPDTKIKLEPKHAIRTRLGRSPDKADAFVLTFAYNVHINNSISKFKPRKRSKWSVFDRFRERRI